MIKTIQTDRFTMDYAVFGNGGTPFVILPGISMKPVTPSEKALQAGFRDFTESHTVYLFDRVRNLPDAYPVKDMAKDTADAMRTLGLSHADVYGASQGGMIALSLALDAPELVDRMVLAGTCSRMNAVSSAVLSKWAEMARRGEGNPLNEAMFDGMFTDPFLAQYRHILLAVNADPSKEELRRIGILCEACLTFDVYDRLGEIKQKTWVAGGSEDAILTPEASCEIAEKVGGLCTIYEGYRHAFYDEVPDFRSQMLAFLLS